MLPPEDIRDEEFSEEGRDWWESRARRDMTDDEGQQEDILVKV